MKEEKRKQLEAAGWKVGTTQEFLGLTAQEQAYIDLKLTLSRLLKKVRQKNGLTQSALAKRINSSQSRVAKMEAGDPGVSVDLIIKGLLALDVARETLGENIKHPQLS